MGSALQGFFLRHPVAGHRATRLTNVKPPAAARAWAGERGEGVEIEATGGLTLDVAAEYGATGIDYMSVGALTHSSPIIDLALDLA